MKRTPQRTTAFLRRLYGARCRRKMVVCDQHVVGQVYELSQNFSDSQRPTNAQASSAQTRPAQTKPARPSSSELGPARLSPAQSSPTRPRTENAQASSAQPCTAQPKPTGPDNPTRSSRQAQGSPPPKRHSPRPDPSHTCPAERAPNQHNTALPFFTPQPSPKRNAMGILK